MYIEARSNYPTPFVALSAFIQLSLSRTTEFRSLEDDDYRSPRTTIPFMGPQAHFLLDAVSSEPR